MDNTWQNTLMQTFHIAIAGNPYARWELQSNARTEQEWCSSYGYSKWKHGGMIELGEEEHQFKSLPISQMVDAGSKLLVPTLRVLGLTPEFIREAFQDALASNIQIYVAEHKNAMTYDIPLNSESLALMLDDKDLDVTPTDEMMERHFGWAIAGYGDKVEVLGHSRVAANVEYDETFLWFFTRRTKARIVLEQSIDKDRFGWSLKKDGTVLLSAGRCYGSLLIPLRKLLRNLSLYNDSSRASW